MRKRKLNHEDEEKLARELLSLDESFFQVDEVKVAPFFQFDGGKIVECEQCGELLVETKTVSKEGKTVCKACAGLRYYEPQVKK